MDNLLPDYYTRVHELMNDLSEEEKLELTRLLHKIGSRIPHVRMPVTKNAATTTAAAH